MRHVAMLPHKDALPGTESTMSVAHGDRDFGLGEYASDMGGHVIRPFLIVDVIGVTVLHQFAHKVFQILAYCRISIFCNNERRTGVLEKDMAKPVVYTTFSNDMVNFAGDIGGSTTIGGDADLLLFNHGIIVALIESMF